MKTAQILSRKSPKNKVDELEIAAYMGVSTSKRGFHTKTPGHLHTNLPSPVRRNSVTRSKSDKFATSYFSDNDVNDNKTAGGYSRRDSSGSNEMADGNNVFEIDDNSLIREGSLKKSDPKGNYWRTR